jgi:hypothetical protein
METRLSAVDFIKVRAAMTAQAALRRAERKGRTLRVPGDPASLKLEACEATAPPLTYHLTYRDEAGRESQRIVTLRRLDPDRSGLKLICWCHGAGAIRCFSLNGVIEVFDVVTGEVHDDAHAFFANHPLLTAPENPVDYALQVCRHEVNVLVAIGAADGRFDPDEQDAVIIHVFDRMPELVMDEYLMRDRLCRFTPDVGAFQAAMVQMGQFRRGDPIALLRSVRKLVDADGKISPEEAIFAQEVQSLLGAAAR